MVLDNLSANTGNLANYAGATGLGGDFFSKPEAASLSDWGKYDWSTNNQFTPDVVNSVEAAPPTGFTFITAPGDISYAQNSDVKTISMFGTNEPPVTVGQTNMKKLTLGNALMEGFIVGKSVQRPIDDLFAMMNVELTKGFVNVAVYSVFANQKSYSAREGGWIIESVNVKEELRDLKGNLTRAIVDVSLQEVGSYQINSGIDQANQPGAPPNGNPAATGQVASQDAAVAQAAFSKSFPAKTITKQAFTGGFSFG